MTEEYQLSLGYSTFTRLLHKLELRDSPDHQRCARVEAIPGEEMQHDTSPYVLTLGGKPARVQCAGLYYRYSTVRYIRFYRSFDKFTAKSFMHEAASFWKFVGKQCVIDNTSVIVLRGTGKNAVFHADMNSFAKRLGFQWLAHELNHPDRKAGKERNFWTVETNFIPGRTFRDMEDLNRQALAWATERYFRRPHDKTKLVPASLWELEKPHLQPIPEYVEPPYREHERVTDRYGYIALHANYYWVPGTKRETVKVIEYPGRIKLFKNHEVLIEYPLKPEGVKYEHVKPDGVGAPKKAEHFKLTAEAEEGKLRSMDPLLEKYLEFIRTPEGAIHQRNRFVKNLYSLSLRIAPRVFLQALERALIYKINNVDAVERIATQLMREGSQEWPEISFCGEFRSRQAYLEGRLSEEPDLFSYAKLLKPEGGSGNGSGSEDS